MTASHGSGIEVTATWGSEFICGLSHNAQVSIAVSVELMRRNWRVIELTRCQASPSPDDDDNNNNNNNSVCCYLSTFHSDVCRLWICLCPQQSDCPPPDVTSKCVWCIGLQGPKACGMLYERSSFTDCMLLVCLVKLLSLSVWIPWIVKVKCSCKLLLCLSIVSKRSIWGLGHKIVHSGSCCWMGMTALFNPGESVTPPHTMTLQRRVSGLQNVTAERNAQLLPGFQSWAFNP